MNGTGGDANGSPTLLGDRYELRELIGQGGMADVRLAFDRVLKREVAVKLMRVTLAGDVDRRRFATETRLLASLNHPNLVTLLDAGVDESTDPPRPWLAMELVTGACLADRVADDGPLPPADVAAIGVGLARALAHVHAAGVVHRDVKPANVLLSTTGAAKLADFGVARAAGVDSGLTATGYTIGTAAYLAPEQVTGAEVSGASDVYALGLVLLEALTGVRAYPGPSTEAALARLHHGPTIPVSLGARWARLLAAMTAVDPLERPGAAAVADQLRRPGGVVADPAPTAAVTTVVPVGGASAASWYRRRAALLPVGTLVVVLVLLGGILWAGSGSPSAPAAASGPSLTASTRPASPSRTSTAPVVSATAPVVATPTTSPTQTHPPVQPQPQPPTKVRPHPKAHHHGPKHHRPKHHHRGHHHHKKRH